MKSLVATCCLLSAGLIEFSAVAVDPPAAVIERGKAATALILDHTGKPMGAAFCVDPSGVFVTNLLLVLDAKVDLVLRLGQKGEQKVPARIVYAAKDPWCSVLSVAGVKGLVALERRAAGPTGT